MIIAATKGGRRIVVLATAFACTAALAAEFRPNGAVAAAIGAPALLLAALLWTAGGRQAGFAAAVLVVAVTGLLRGGSGAAHSRSLQPFIGAGPVFFRGVAAGTTVGASPVVDIAEITGSGGEATDAGTVLLAPAPGSVPIEPGNEVEITSSGLHRPGGRPGAADAGHLDELGVGAVAAAARVTVLRPGGTNLPRLLLHVRQRLAGGIDAVLPDPPATLILGVVLGLRRPLPVPLTAALQDTGLIHVIVVSGLKISILAGMLRGFCDAAAWSHRARVATVVPAIAMYVAISGAGPAAVRSAVMAVASLVLGRRGRRGDVLPLLALTAAGMVAINPSVAREVGFQLSFAGTLGIVLLAEPIGERIAGPRLLVEPFATTVAAQLATFPLMASTFGVIALVAPLANALVLPLLPPLIVLGGAGALLAVLSPLLGWVPLQLAALGVRWMAFLAEQLARIPGAAIHPGAWPAWWTVVAACGGAGAWGVAAWRSRRHPGRLGPGEANLRHGGPVWKPGSRSRGIAPPGAAPWAAAFLAASAAVAFFAIHDAAGDGRIHLTVLDVGPAGSAVLVRSPHGGIALVDAGASAAALDGALGRVLPMTVHTLDLVVLSGGERAAAGGLAGVAAHHRVARAVVPMGDVGPATRTTLLALHEAGSAITVVTPGGGFTWDGLRWRCLPVPPSDTPAVAPLCAVGIADPRSQALLLGGATAPLQEELATTASSLTSVALLVTGPGGVTSPALLDAVRPRRVAIPGGRPAPAAGVTLPGARSTATDGDLEYILDRGSAEAR